MLQLPGGDSLRFLLSMPESVAGPATHPLVVVLHYAGEVTPFYGQPMLEGLVQPALDELKPIIVAPDSLGGDWTNPRNEQAVIYLVEKVKETYAVDGRKVLLTGFSMGGHGTWYLASRHQDVFTVAIPIAGSPAGGEAAWRIPVLAIHSDSDEVLPAKRTEDEVRKLKQLGLPVELRIIHGITHFETLRYQEALKGTLPWLKAAWGMHN